MVMKQLGKTCEKDTLLDDERGLLAAAADRLAAAGARGGGRDERVLGRGVLVGLVGPLG